MAVATESKESLIRTLAQLTALLDDNAAVAGRVHGFHLDGQTRPLTWAEFRRLQDTAGGRIRMVTLSLEPKGSIAFIEKLTAAGVVVAIGARAATSMQFHAAVEAARRLNSYLAVPPPGGRLLLDHVIWEQLADDTLWTSIVADSLPADMMQNLLQTKTPGRCVLASGRGNAMDQGVSQVISVGGASLADAIDMASVRRASCSVCQHRRSKLVSR